MDQELQQQVAVVLAAAQPVVHHVRLVVDEHAVVEVLAAVVHPWLLRISNLAKVYAVNALQVCSGGGCKSAMLCTI